MGRFCSHVQMHFIEGTCCLIIQNSMKLVPGGRIERNSALFYVMPWFWTSDKISPVSMMIKLLDDSAYQKESYEDIFLTNKILNSVNVCIIQQCVYYRSIKHTFWSFKTCLRNYDIKRTQYPTTEENSSTTKDGSWIIEVTILSHLGTSYKPCWCLEHLGRHLP